MLEGCQSTRMTGLVFSRVSLTSLGEGTSLALCGHPSSDAVTIKIPYGVDVLLHNFIESDFIIRSVETDLER